jgi:predicted phosphodiesterase
MRRRSTTFVALLLACVASALAGSYLVVRAFSATTEPFALGTVRASAFPALRGRVDVYVPIVDWGVRASPYDAPVALQLRFRSLDREQARSALRSGAAARQRLDVIRQEVAEIGRHALIRGALLALVGGLGGGLLGGGLIGAALHRRRWLAYGAAVGVFAPAVFCVVVASTLRHVDYSAFERPTFYAHGRELSRLLSFSKQLLTAKETYTRSYEEALAGLATLVAYAGESPAPETATTAVFVASDLHANALVLPVLEEYAAGKTIFLVGDFTLLGTRPETRLVPSIGHVARQVVAVSGNHDSRPFMVDLVRAGVVVLTRDGRLLSNGTADGDPVVQIAGLDVAGYDDPLERPGNDMSRHRLELTDEQFAVEAERFVSWFDALPTRPDVVLVHQHGLAHTLLDSLDERGAPPLLIFTGHDHKQHLERTDGHVLVDGGTLGAGGPFAIGVQPAGFAQVHFTKDHEPRAVDLIEVEPISGNARASRTTLTSPPR